MLRSVFLLAAMLPAAVQARTVEDEQAWLNVSVFGKAGEDVVWFVEAQPRVGDGVSRVSQLLLRGAVGVQLTPSLTLWQGYAHVVLPIAGGRDRNEERSFQQLWWTIKPGFWVRTRLEQRWLSTGSEVGFRLRSMVRYGLPLTKQKRGVAALLTVEPYFNLNDTDWGARSGFDQLRSFAGIEIPTIGKSTVEIGYLNQRINDPGGRIRSNHIAAVNVFFRL